MKFYTSVNQYGNNILVRGLNNGHAVQDRIAFKPALYVPNKDKATAKSLFGKPLAEIKFDSINDAKEYVKMYKEVEGFEIYGNTNYGYQYISQQWPHEVEFDMTQLKIWQIQIHLYILN